jgi:hypothetical protein
MVKFKGLKNNLQNNQSSIRKYNHHKRMKNKVKVSKMEKKRTQLPLFSPKQRPFKNANTHKQLNTKNQQQHIETCQP